MKYLFDEDEETEVERGQRGLGRARKAESSDTEITLGMRSILGIFFGLVLICGIFFGLGYSVGRGSSARTAAAAASSATADGSESVPDSHLPKPSATEGGDAAASPAPVPVDEDQQGGTAVVPESGTASSGSPTATAPQPAAATPAVATAAQPTAAVRPAVASAAPATSPVSVAPVSAQAGPARTYMVQIAAVRLQQDADVLVSALKKHNYNAVVRHEAQDQWLHVQIGPFATHAEANSMRSRLLADGYNAVVK